MTDAPPPKRPQSATPPSIASINPLWPKIVDQQSAIYASAGEGLLASLVAIGVTLEASHVLPSIAIWINVVLFAGVGIGCWFMVRAAPCVGLLLALANVVLTLNAATEMDAAKVALGVNGLMLLAYINAIRGAFAYPRFARTLR
jgi:hypothetical protein